MAHATLKHHLISLAIGATVAFAALCVIVLLGGVVGCAANPKRPPADGELAKQATEIGRTFGGIGVHQDNIDTAAKRILDEVDK